MSVVCPHCKPKRTRTFPAQWVFPKSRVLATRRVNSHRIFRGKVKRTFTLERYRECKACGYRWKTIEYVEPAKRGRVKYNLGKAA